MQAALQLGDCQIKPETNIRILGLQVDSELRWGPHIRKIQKKMASQTLALLRITASTWGATFAKTKQIYNAVVRPATTYGAAIWHTPESIGGRKKIARDL
jgi:hypothetical protein